jgi:hypothetical protein
LCSFWPVHQLRPRPPARQAVRVGHLPDPLAEPLGRRATCGGLGGLSANIFRRVSLRRICSWAGPTEEAERDRKGRVHRIAPYIQAPPQGLSKAGSLSCRDALEPKHTAHCTLPGHCPGSCSQKGKPRLTEGRGCPCRAYSVLYGKAVTCGSGVAAGACPGCSEG